MMIMINKNKIVKCYNRNKLLTISVKMKKNITINLKRYKKILSIKTIFYSSKDNNNRNSLKNKS